MRDKEDRLMLRIAFKVLEENPEYWDFLKNKTPPREFIDWDKREMHDLKRLINDRTRQCIDTCHSEGTMERTLVHMCCIAKAGWIEYANRAMNIR